MPRKLLRVALVAAVIPALTPVMSQAETGKAGSAVRTASSPAARQTPTWWQRLRGQKPTTASAKVVKVGADLSADKPAASSSSPFELEGNSDVQLLRPRSARVRPTFTEQAQPAVTAKTPVVESASEAVASPIQAAAPPKDVTAEYRAPRGDVARYNRVGMMDPETTGNDAGSDVEFAEPMAPTPAQPISRTPAVVVQPVPAPAPVPVPIAGPVPGFVRLDAAMYPSPEPGIPLDVGSTMITNPAFDPHEMLYAHRYRGLYGPFYHKTNRFWVLTPFGIYKGEKRTLMGTEVRVNYKSHISPFSLFFPPVTH